VEAFLGMFVSAAICFFFSWQLGLVVTAVSPLMALGGLGMSKLQFNQKGVEDAYKHANALLSDIVINYRTIISFGPKNVEFILSQYGELLEIPHDSNVKKAHFSGLFFGYSQSIRFVFIAFVFYVAYVFVSLDYVGKEAAFTGCYVVFVGSIGSGVSLSQLPSISGAQASAKKVFGIIEEPTKINPKQKGGKDLTKGQVEFRNVSFRYPSRKNYVMRRLSLVIKPNTSVALVGPSGSGKSTIASLLLRFYDPQHGKILIDN
jgi:ATP-binding cassette subfamily B (MDR/TAP) protein 1